MPMTSPYLTIDLDKIEHNTRTIVALCQAHGIEVSGVTKVTCGHPAVARAMLRGGVVSIADSRFENLRRMQADGVDSRFMLLRLPPLSAVHEVVELADVSLNSELVVLEALSAAALQRGKVHEVILMVDLGDLREGVWSSALPALVEAALALPGIRIAGLGCNLACFAGVIPSAENMQRLVTLAGEMEQRYGITLDTLSAINSSGLDLIAAGAMPPRINQARIGEAILLGRETTHRRPWPDTHQNAFTLHAEVLELQRKPAVPQGELGEDAFGHHPHFDGSGQMLRALLNIGREDMALEGIAPFDTRLRILGASSGYLMMDATALEGELHVGDTVGFSLNYAALLAAMTSEYVQKVVL